MAVILLDGAIGQELVHRAGDRPTPLWSTQAMIDHPDLLRQVHDAYFAAGATVATTNTYALLRDRLVMAGVDETQLEPLTAQATRTAREARDAFGQGRVAGSVGPLIASYRPDICPPAARAAELYSETVALLKDQVDLLLIETMSSVDQADGALRACTGQGLPVWLAVSVMDGDGTRLRSGEALGDLAPLVDRFAPDAVLINCSPPEVIGAGLEIVKSLGRPFGAFGNGFTRIDGGFLEQAPTVDALRARNDLGPSEYADLAMGWVDQGASIIGGCCEVGPAHIAELRRRLG